MESQPVDKLQLSRVWCEAMMSDNPAWPLGKSTNLIRMHRDKPLVVWEAKDGQPEVLTLLRMTDVGLGFSGPRLTLLDVGTQRAHSITATPQEIFPGVFVWIPAFAEVHYTPVTYAQPKSPRRLTVPICIRMRSHSQRDVRDGITYITDLFEFQAQWPNVK